MSQMRRKKKNLEQDIFNAMKEEVIEISYNPKIFEKRKHEFVCHVELFLVNAVRDKLHTGEDETNCALCRIDGLNEKSCNKYSVTL